MSGGARITRRVLNHDPIVVYGTHEPIISAAQFARVQQQLADRTRTSSARSDRALLNPFRGLIVCGVCGKRMQRKANTGHNFRNASIYCVTPGCPTCASQVDALETVLLNALNSIAVLGDKINVSPNGSARTRDTAPTQNISALLEPGPSGIRGRRFTINRHLKGAKQYARHARSARTPHRATATPAQAQQELLETEVYDIDTYVSRNADITSQIAGAKSELEALRRTVRKGYTARQIAAVTSMLREYDRSAPPEAKQHLLAAVIDHVIYRRDSRAYRNGDLTQGISLDVHLRSF